MNKENLVIETRASALREMKIAADEGYAILIRETFERIGKTAHSIETQAIAAANDSRILGGLVVAWMDKEQTRFEAFEQFFHDHTEQLPKGFTSGAARRFVSAHRNFPDEVTDLKTATAILQQMTFFAVGMMDEPKRLTQQHQSPLTPLALFLNSTARQREMLAKLKEECPLSTWDETTWTTILHETEDAAALHAEAVERLKIMVT